MEHLSGIAMHDALTGLPNRRYMESFLSYKLDEFGRFGKLFAVLFADIDNFGRFNNEYGHETGDAVLKSIATSIQKNLRRDDLIGRWGGEEIVGVYAVSRPYDVPILAEKFRQLVENTEIIHSGQPLHVSVSVGATLVQPSDTANSILQRADHFMYKSKQAGKNRVTSD